jgi:hypothetical protein
MACGESRVSLFFNRKAEEPSPPAQLPVLYEAPVQPSAAPKATELERLIRAQVVDHDDVARDQAAGQGPHEFESF